MRTKASIMITTTERQELILDTLKQQGRVHVDELVRICGCSGPTIRRDLQKLEADGKIVRTHGGCVSADHMGLEVIWQERLRARSAEKRRIGEKAASFVRDGQVLILDTGSTVFHVVDFLREKRGLTIITNFPPIISRIGGREDWKIILTGGTLRSDKYDLAGPLAERVFEGISADIALIGAEGLSLRGPGGSDEEVCRLDTLMIAAAAEKFLLADSSKIGQRATFRYAAWSDIDRLITDRSAGKKFVDTLRRKGVAVDLV